MNAQCIKDVEESARLFEENLEPLFEVIAASSRNHVMDALSASLRKALLLMAIDRYGCDKARICRALGITRARLEKELKLCSLPHWDSKVAWGLGGVQGCESTHEMP